MVAVGIMLVNSNLMLFGFLSKALGKTILRVNSFSETIIKVGRKKKTRVLTRRAFENQVQSLVEKGSEKLFEVFHCPVSVE